MISVNSRSTEGSHVKTNLVHTLYRMQKYRLQPLDKFVEMLRPSERNIVMPSQGRGIGTLCHWTCSRLLFFGLVALFSSMLICISFSDVSILLNLGL